MGKQEGLPGAIWHKSGAMHGRCRGKETGLGREVRRRGEENVFTSQAVNCFWDDDGVTRWPRAGRVGNTVSCRVYLALGWKVIDRNWRILEGSFLVVKALPCSVVRSFPGYSKRSKVVLSSTFTPPLLKGPNKESLA